VLHDTSGIKAYNDTSWAEMSNDNTFWTEVLHNTSRIEAFNDTSWAQVFNDTFPGTRTTTANF
jgi:hypothetical protein